MISNQLNNLHDSPPLDFRLGCWFRHNCEHLLASAWQSAQRQLSCYRGSHGLPPRLKVARNDMHSSISSKAMAHQARGFTLIEISIVLVIIGLIVGGVLVGKELIQAATIRKDATMMEEVDRSILTFKLKYNALAGDMPNAYNFFGGDAGCTNVDTNTTAAGCNGDGNNRWTTYADGQYREGFRVWQQLALAGLYPGTYTGTNGPSDGRDAVIGSNIPKSASSGGGFTLTWAPYITADGWMFAGNYGNNIFFGADHSSIYYTVAPIYTPINAYSLDTKIDDGKPGTGRLRVWHSAGSGQNCASSSDPAAATFRTDLTSIECAFVYMLTLK